MSFIKVFKKFSGGKGPFQLVLERLFQLHFTSQIMEMSQSDGELWVDHYAKTFKNAPKTLLKRSKHHLDECHKFITYWNEGNPDIDKIPLKYLIVSDDQEVVAKYLHELASYHYMHEYATRNAHSRVIANKSRDEAYKRIDAVKNGRQYKLDVRTWMKSYDEPRLRVSDAQRIGSVLESIFAV